MHKIAKAALAVAGALLLCGQAFGEEVRIPRKGSSPGFGPSPATRPSKELHSSPDLYLSPRRPQGDWVRCWKLAQEAKPTDGQAAQNLVVGYLIGGVIGALIASSIDQEAYDDRYDTSRRQAYNECMAKRRYNNDD